MKFTLFYVSLLLSLQLALVRSDAKTPEAYWKRVLPNSPMPKAIKDLLYNNEWTQERNTSVGVSAGGVAVNAGTPDRNTSVHVGNGVSVNTTIEGRPVRVGVLQPGPNPFFYSYAASDDQLNDSPNIALFFLEKNLHPGTKMKLHFKKDESQKAMFLPRQVADSIPFSSNKLPEIYTKFSVNPNSLEAKIMKQTLSKCESKGIEGEEKYCATSIESMIDFSTGKLGKRVKAISTEVNAKKSSPLQKYIIYRSKKLATNKGVACHKQKYMYAVFYCHKTESTKAYMVSLVGADGTKVKAVVVCHTNTAKWNPKHLSFQVLKVKPGTVPICHFLPEDHIVWVPY